MSSRPFRSRIALFVLVLILIAPWASAAQPQHRHAGRAAEATSNPVSWSLLEILQGLLTGSWEKNGCSLDPNGKPVCQQDSGTVTSENGCSSDPDGRCRTRS
ncbi:MAG: hypothetical protein QOF89_5746 [Acidobacteriota bacterium]|jgi:hypothetical protein|nr:hypothetical protein [Acidobacteriota bacterium]